MDVEFRHLRAFIAVVDAGTFTAASRALRITQPALTRTVQQLEAALGIRLLDRTTRTVSLTNGGRRFLERSQAIVGALADAVAEAHGARELRIGFSWTLPDPWISDTMAAFEMSTGVPARLVRRDDLAADLVAGAIDVALFRHELDDPRVTSRTLFTEPRTAAVSARSALATRESITWNELSAYPVVVNTVSGNTRPELWDADHRPTSIVPSANYDEWISLIAADRGVGATTLSSTVTYAHAGVAFIRLVDAPPVPLRIAWTTAHAGSLVEAFVDVATSSRASN